MQFFRTAFFTTIMYKVNTLQKINFQLETDRVIGELCADGNRPALLLHACCAPCASYVLEYLSQYFDITVFFCSPNITDSDEYAKRLDALYKLVGAAPFCKNVKIVEDDISTDMYFNAIKGFENEPEGGKRCDVCFKLRMERTAEYALKNGYSLFATTLTVSPHKNPMLINAIGEELSDSLGVRYLPSDFKKRGGYQRSIVLSREYGIYRQNYCGCVFSDYNGGSYEPDSEN